VGVHVRLVLSILALHTTTLRRHPSPGFRSCLDLPLGDAPALLGLRLHDGRQASVFLASPRGMRPHPADPARRLWGAVLPASTCAAQSAGRPAMTGYANRQRTARAALRTCRLSSAPSPAPRPPDGQSTGNGAPRTGAPIKSVRPRGGPAADPGLLVLVGFTAPLSGHSPPCGGGTAFATPGLKLVRNNL
jgi:hypothetical protein